MTRNAIREVFGENPGSAARVARRIGVNKGSVSRWLSGERPNQPNVEAACRAEAERLLKGERS